MKNQYTPEQLQEIRELVAAAYHLGDAHCAATEIYTSAHAQPYYLSEYMRMQGLDMGDEEHDFDTKKIYPEKFTHNI